MMTIVFCGSARSPSNSRSPRGAGKQLARRNVAAEAGKKHQPFVVHAPGHLPDVGRLAGQEIVNAQALSEAEAWRERRAQHVEIDQTHVDIGDARKRRGQIGCDEGLARVRCGGRDTDNLQPVILTAPRDLRAQQLERPHAGVRIAEAVDVRVRQILGGYGEFRQLVERSIERRRRCRDEMRSHWEMVPCSRFGHEARATLRRWRRSSQRMRR